MFWYHFSFLRRRRFPPHKIIIIKVQFLLFVFVAELGYFVVKVGVKEAEENRETE